MRIFISAGEPSGDLHGANFIRAMNRLSPEVDFEGYGGEKMAAAGCDLLYPLAQHAHMGFGAVLKEIGTFTRILSQTDRWFQHHRPDALVLIDYPGLHWWLARRAHFHGIPVFYFVPPQIWAWLSYRVKKMKRWVDHVLCTLPFEKAWYEERGVNATYIGHPYFDELRQQLLNAEFIAAQKSKGGRIVALLPGSRNQEVRMNFPSMIRSVQMLNGEFPQTRFLVACFKQQHLDWVNEAIGGLNLPIQSYVGKTPEIIHLADACIAASGSVSLELLNQALPSVIVYRVSRALYEVGRRLVTCKYGCLVNLLADKLLYPEYLTYRCEAANAARHIGEWLRDDNSRLKLTTELHRLRAQVCQPGACERAARYVLGALRGETKNVDRLPVHDAA